MTKWVKTNGVIVELNDDPETIKKANELGWVRDDGNSGTSSESSTAKDPGTSRRGSSKRK